MTSPEQRLRRIERRGMPASERRQQIVDTAANLFDRSGYATTTMDDIAAAVGVAKPTLYHYFKSKDGILSSIHEEFIDLLLMRHERRLEVGLSPEQMLLEVIADILELMETHRGHVRAFFEHHRELPEPTRGNVRVKRDRYEQMVETIFREGVEDGSFRALDTHLATLATFGMANWAYQWFRTDGSLRPREIAYQFWNYLVQGVTARPS